jgi:hypothetical protein
MRTVFLSCHFGETDRELVRRAEGLLESHNLRVVTGEELGGGGLTAEVMQRITDCDSLVALMTKREWEPNNAGTHPWVVDEYKYARGIHKPSIAIVAPGVNVIGAYQEQERIDYDPSDTSKAVLRLSKTIGLWKSQAGRLLKVQVFPREIAEKSRRQTAAHGVCIACAPLTELWETGDPLTRYLRETGPIFILRA